MTRSLQIRPVEENDETLRLDQFLAGAREELSRREARRLIDLGAVWINGARVRIASRRMRAGMKVEIFLDPIASEARTEILPEQILYEDQDLIAVDKPSGTLAQASPGDDRHHLFAQTRRYLRLRDSRGGRGRQPYLAIHHRLDSGTSGVMLFAKRREVNRGLTDVFKESRVRKVYHALCTVAGTSPPEASWTVSNHLSAAREGLDGVRRVLIVGPYGGRRADTEFRVLSALPGAAWIEAVPLTGRTHQLRVHLADSDLPVLGDNVYGREDAPYIPSPRLMLHAASLTLEHPRTGEPLFIESPLPLDFRRQVHELELGGAPDSLLEESTPDAAELARLLGEDRKEDEES